MKKIILGAVLALFSVHAFGVQKCLVDGKTLYKNGPCPAGTPRLVISGGTLSSLDTSGMRTGLAAVNVNKNTHIAMQK